MVGCRVPSSKCPQRVSNQFFENLEIEITQLGEIEAGLAHRMFAEFCEKPFLVISFGDQVYDELLPAD